jgi:hypothetical protein
MTVLATALAAVLLPAATAARAGGATGRAPTAGTAHAARALPANDNARLHLVHESGTRLVEEGGATGSLAGTIKGYFNVGPTVTGSVTLHVHGGGSISGRGSGKLHNANGHLYESFAGSLTITGGTGRYKHAHGHAAFYGSINRSNDAMQVQTRGTLDF